MLMSDATAIAGLFQHAGPSHNNAVAGPSTLERYPSSVSIVSSTSNSSDGHYLHHHHQQHQQQFGVQVKTTPRIKIQTASSPKTDEGLQLPQGVAAVIVESPIEDANAQSFTSPTSPVSPVTSPVSPVSDSSNSDKAAIVAKAKEVNVGVDVDTPLPAAIPRPRNSRFSDESVERRKSLTFGLFGKSSNSNSSNNGLNVSGAEVSSIFPCSNLG